MQRVNKRWSQGEDTYLKENKGKIPYFQIAKQLSRTIEAVGLRAGFLGLRKKRGHNWAKEEVEFIKTNYQKMKCKDIAKKLGLTFKQTQAKIHYLKLTKGITESQRDMILRRLRETNFPHHVIASEFGISRGTIRRIAREHGIQRKSGFKSVFPLLHGFKYGNNSGSSEHRHALLHAYKNTCWDCKKTFVNINDLQIHHDFSKLPVEALVLCKLCHGKRHKRKFVLS